MAGKRNKRVELVHRDSRAAGSRTQRPNIQAPTDLVYRFKITLKDSSPAIWRRIEVRDCTLDEFHWLIQGAMGWTNSHLNQFIIGKKYFGNPEFIDDDDELRDSTTTKVSEILPARGRKFRFEYEYDFGDSWIHTIEFEGKAPPDPNAEYPRCTDGARACPIEDIGGIWRYDEIVRRISRRTKNDGDEADDGDWDFDPADFDVEVATKSMREEPVWDEPGWDDDDD